MDVKLLSCFLLLCGAALAHPHFDDDVGSWDQPPPLPENARIRRAISGPATVEVLAVVDYKMARKLKTLGNTNYQKQYLASYYRGISLRYEAITNFKISVVLVGTYFCKSNSDCPFMGSQNKVGSYISANKAIEQLREWLYQRKSSLGAFDVAMVHTGKDICSGTSPCNGGTSGWAYIGTACRAPDSRGYMWNCGIFEDDGGFGNTVVAAHEIAHTLNVNHDGQSGVKCPASDGYIMGKRKGSNGFKFSSCSLSQMKAFLEKTSCLFTKQATQIKSSYGYPGMFMDGDKQCKTMFGKDSFPCWTDQRICTKMGCRVSSRKRYTCRWNGGAAEGTVCGNNKVCLGGTCVTDPN